MKRQQVIEIVLVVIVILQALVILSFKLSNNNVERQNSIAEENQQLFYELRNIIELIHLSSFTTLNAELRMTNWYDKKEISLKQICQKRTLVFQMSQENCSDCIDKGLSHFMQLKQDNSDLNAVIIVNNFDHNKLRQILREYDIRQNVYLTPQSSGYDLNQFLFPNMPHFYILDKDLLKKFVFPIDIIENDLLSDYIESIKLHIFN